MEVGWRASCHPRAACAATQRGIVNLVLNPDGFYALPMAGGAPVAYVSPSGSNANPGTSPAVSLQTLAAARAKLTLFDREVPYRLLLCPADPLTRNTWWSFPFSYHMNRLALFSDVINHLGWDVPAKLTRVRNASQKVVMIDAAAGYAGVMGDWDPRNPVSIPTQSMPFTTTLPTSGSWHSTDLRELTLGH